MSGNKALFDALLCQRPSERGIKIFNAYFFLLRPVCMQEEAILLLVQDSSNILAGIMSCSILQESGDHTGADSLLRGLMASTEIPEAITLLRIRQYRCEGIPEKADSLALEMVNDAGKELSSLIKLDLLLAGNSTVQMDCSDILTAMRTDIILTGSVYMEPILSRLASSDMEIEEPFKTARILLLAGDRESAERIISSLLEMSADSVILINRTRNWFREDQLETLTESNVWENGNRSFSGNLSLSYYQSTGEYPQENVSLGGSVRYRYGLYNSRISTSAYFSNNDWPGTETSLKTLNLSAS